MRRWWLMLAMVVWWLPVTVQAQGLNPQTDPTAQLRFVHAFLGAPPVDVYLDGQRVVAGLPPGEATRYGLTAPGEHGVAIRAAGSAATTAPLLQQVIELQAGSSYTLAVTGSRMGPAAFLYQDDVAATGTGEGSLRLVHLAPGRGAVAAAVDEAALTPPIAYGQASPRQFVAAGATEPVVTIGSETGAPLLTTPPVPLEGGQFYTIFVAEGATGLQPIIISYALNTGAPPSGPVWGPVTAGNQVFLPAVTLPAAGVFSRPDAQPLWLVLGGLGLMTLAVGGRWAWERRTSG